MMTAISEDPMSFKVIYLSDMIDGRLKSCLILISDELCRVSGKSDCYQRRRT